MLRPNERPTFTEESDNNNDFLVNTKVKSGLDRIAATNCYPTMDQFTEIIQLADEEEKIIKLLALCVGRGLKQKEINWFSTADIIEQAAELFESAMKRKTTDFEYYMLSSGISEM